MARLLILGGTAEAAELAARLAGDDRLETVTSLAGLTRLPNVGAGHVRRGGFGGPDGLAAFLKDGGYDALIDATHPFAAQIAAHAAEAAEKAGVPRMKLLRPAFERTPEDRFIPVADINAAAAALPRERARFPRRRPARNRALRGAERPVVPRPHDRAAGGGRNHAGRRAYSRPPARRSRSRDRASDEACDRLDRVEGFRRAGRRENHRGAQARPAGRVGRAPAPPAGPTVATVDAAIDWIETTLFARK